MRIAFFTTYLTDIKSGPGRFVEQLRSFHSEKDIEFIFYSDNADISTSNVVKTPRISFFHSFPGYWLIRSFSFYRAIRNSTGNFDLIICSNAFEAFFIVLLIREIPVIVMINDDNYIYAKNHFKIISRKHSFRILLSRLYGFFIEKFVARKATKIIACSHYLKEVINSSYRVQESKIEVIYPAVDLKSFPFSGERQFFKNLTINILFAKNDWRRGGLEVAIEALSKCKKLGNFHLTIVGNSEFEKNQILEIAQKFDFHNNVSIHGIVTKEELSLFLRTSDILILASRQEAFGIILLEAMATGTPIIATNVGGIPEVLDNGNAGFLIPPDTPLELSILINQLLNNPKLVLPKIENGFNQCKKFSTNILYSNLDKFLIRFRKINEDSL